MGKERGGKREGRGGEGPPLLFGQIEPWSSLSLLCCHSFIAHLSHHAPTFLLLPHLTLSSRIRLPLRPMLILHTFHQHFFSSLLIDVLCAGTVPFFLHAFFSVVTLSLIQELLTLLYVLSISVPFFTHSILLPYLISLSPIIRICSVLPKLGLKTPLPALNLLHST